MGYSLGPVDQSWTIRRVLAWAAQDFTERGIDTARLDAELLVAASLGLSRVSLYMDLDRPLSDAERELIREKVKRRRRREPVAYILGKKEFYGRSFEVSPAVLVPRPDTEVLLERALELLPPDSDARVLDLCTGSGAIGLSIAAERAGVTVDLTDISEPALAIAQKNASSLSVAERARFFHGDLFAPLPPDARYGLVTCNPPYIAEREIESLAPDVRDHEPRQALVAGADGFDVHRRLVAETAPFLSPGGTLLVEVGATQAIRLEQMLAAAEWVESTARHRDLGGIERVVEARRR